MGSEDLINKPLAYAAWHENPEIQKRCVSGGIATALAFETVSQGGVVFGAAYDGEMNLHFIGAETTKDLFLLSGSKYTHCVIGKDIFERVIQEISVGRKVMFCGLPCQCAAMHNFLKSKNINVANFLLVDVVCFGAPPHSLWKKYINWLEDKAGKKLKSINPRDKGRGWQRTTYYRYDWVDGTTKCQNSVYDSYSQAFYRAISFRRCCYDCQFRGVNRVTDITVCDFWGAEQLSIPSEIVKNGISGVFIHSKKGAQAFLNAKIKFHKVQVEQIIANNFPVLYSANIPDNWASFVADSDVLSFDAIIKKYHLRISYIQHLRNCLKQTIKKIIKWR